MAKSIGGMLFVRCMDLEGPLSEVPLYSSPFIIPRSTLEQDSVAYPGGGGGGGGGGVLRVLEHPPKPSEACN